ncbi:MAG: DUF4097 family beta strand repeat protein [Deltaproteobacteria bacterium]|nr:DUF4097 family beta strand repeat protein [Deltaproteobacteria bacterium]
MKKTILMSICISIFMAGFNISYAEDKKYNYEIEFGKSGDERVLQFNGSGEVNITGYDGNKVLLSSDESVFQDDKTDEKAKGLRKIGGGGFNIINNKEKNHIIVSRPLHKDINLDVKVPNNTTLKFGTSVVKSSNGFHSSYFQIIGTEFEKKDEEFEKQAEELEKQAEKLEEHAKELEKVSDRIKIKTFVLAPKAGEYHRIAKGGPYTMGGAGNMIMPAPSQGMIEGDITVNEFKGTVEASTIQGNITVKNMDGIVLANTVEGDINVAFKNLDNDKELYFSTVNGDIDITFPKETNADIMARTVEGSVYSGFDGDVTYGNQSDDEESTKDSQLPFVKMFRSDYITTRIHGGGQDIYLNSVDGNIYIRKGE